MLQNSLKCPENWQKISKFIQSHHPVCCLSQFKPFLRVQVEKRFSGPQKIAVRVTVQFATLCILLLHIHIQKNIKNPFEVWRFFSLFLLLKKGHPQELRPVKGQEPWAPRHLFFQQLKGSDASSKETTENLRQAL